MTEKTLRDLAREHAKGNLSKEAYRKARSELVEGIVSGKIPLKDIEFRAPDPAAPDESTDATVPRGHKKKTGIAADPAATSQTAIVRGTVKATRPSKAASEPRGRGGKVLWIVGAVVLLLVLAGTLFVVFSHQNSPASSPAAAPADAGSGSTQTEDNAATRLIGDFLGHKDWSETGMDNILARWSALPAQTRAAAAGSAAQARLDTEIYKQLLEERALSGLGDADKSMARQQRLVDFARQAGIKDPRLVKNSPATSSTGEETQSGTPNNP
jgi:hypothetical protein